MVAASVWTAAGIALAGTALGAVLGFLAAEASDHLRRGREAKAGAVLVFQELVSAYSAARGVMEGFVTRPEELYLRRTAWEAHGGAIARSLSLDEANRVARAYGALDDLDRVLREGAPPS
ncbi:MAG TPA: hypothetical protein VFR32_10620, partial [Gaiellaceae bacterium]|nr:hypothetical protein [Gaiellaceae bacterium]